MSWRSRSFGSYPWWKYTCCSADRQPTAEPPILPVTKHRAGYTYGRSGSSEACTADPSGANVSGCRSIS